MKKFLLLIPVAIALLAAGCNQSTPAAMLKDIQPANQSNTASPIKGTLITYKSDLYGFELRYPADWKLYQATPDQSTSLFVVSADSQMQVVLNTYVYDKKILPLHWLDKIAIANRPSYSRYKGSTYLDYDITKSTMLGKTVVTAVSAFKEAPPNYKPIIVDSRDNESPWLMRRVFSSTAFQCQEKLLCVIEGDFPDEQQYRDIMGQILSTLAFSK